MKKKLLALFITVAIFCIIFRNIDLNLFRDYVSRINFQYLAVALAYFFVYPLVGIERWRAMINLKYRLPFWDALKIYYIGETLNLALPSKAGDLSKGYFLKKAGISSFTYGMSSVFFEKLLDLLSVGFAFFIGLLFLKGGETIYPKIITILMFFLLIFFTFLNFDKMRWIKAILFKFKRRKLLKIFREITSFVGLIKRKHERFFLLGLMAVSILFWLGHLFQIFLFFKAANMEIRYSQVLFYVPIALIVASIPITIGGMGTRDLTLIGLLSAIAPREVIVLGGLLISLRYFVPASIGLLFIQDALEYVKIKRKK